MTQSIDAALSAFDIVLTDSEKLALAVLARVKRLRKLAAAGDLGGIATQLAPMPDAIERLAGAARAAGDSFTYDAESALSDGSYLAELKAEAIRQDVVLVERDGRLSAFPLLLKLEAKAAAVRVGRKLHKAIRPAVLIKTLRAAQASSRFNAGAFLEQVARAYAVLAPQIQSGWSPAAGTDGPTVPLLRIHELLTLLPTAAAEYPREAFACDLLRLNRAPDTQTAHGLGFDLPASTGSKGRERLTVYDEAGDEHIFVGIRMLAGR